MNVTWEKMLKQDERVMLVDSTDDVVGTAGKIEAHQGKGKLHRAVTVFLFDDQGRVLLTQRSANKPLWPLAWDAACSSHQWPGEDDQTCALRRLPFEIGCSARELEFVFRYEYHVVYSPEWAENEINHILKGKVEGDVVRNEKEVAQFRWVTRAELEDLLLTQALPFAPWFAEAWKGVLGRTQA